MSRQVPSPLTQLSCLLFVLAWLLSTQNINDYLPYRLRDARQYLQRQLPQISWHTTSGLEKDDANYQVRLFSRDPLMIYIEDFMTPSEIEHLLHVSEQHYEVAKVYPGDNTDDHLVDEESRISQLAFFKKDPVYDRIARRAMNIQGWRGLSAFIQQPYVQKYEVGGFFTEHYDWDPEYAEGNRITTFLVYLSDNFTGGGTNFPRLTRPRDRRWCDVIECPAWNSTEHSVTGVTFKPKLGSAVFWENMNLNGSFNEEVLHSSLPVLSGVKYGLNMFTWDRSWRAPAA